jgi:hypothetical protein
MDLTCIEAANSLLHLLQLSQTMASNYDCTAGKIVTVLGKLTCAECLWTDGIGLKFQAKSVHCVQNTPLGEFPLEQIPIWIGIGFL